MQQVADAIRKVTAVAQQRYDDGERSATIDLHDVVELLLAIADELDAAGESDLLAAARALLEAREDQMVTSAEWDRLRKAVDAAG